MYRFPDPVPDSLEKTYYFPSSDGRSQIRVKSWESHQENKGTCRGVIHVVHGMSEHIDRYKGFADHMVELGYAVVAQDHIGHGLSVVSEEDLGHIPLDAGMDVMVADIHKLREYVGDYYGSQTPYIMLGHSMGSFLTRVYLARHAGSVDAAIICGTGQQPGMLSAAGNKLARVLCAVKGERFRSSFLHGMGAGAYTKQIKDARTEFDWLSVDPGRVDTYIDDPLCGAMFTVAGYAALTSLTATMVKPACAAAVPKDLPLLFIAGEEDPVGDFAKGVHAAVKQYQDTGCTNVKEIIYPGMRHEILREPDCQQVYLDIHRWLASFHPSLTSETEE